MRTLVVADVHANLAAFEAVLAHARRGGDIDAVWCLGDLVGYGPQPGECIALLKSMPYVAIAGNHDMAVAGTLSLESFNPTAAEAALWTAQHVSEADLAWLEALPPTHIEGDYTLLHGTLKDPISEYLVETAEATQHLALQTTLYCFVGHSHLPLTYYEAPMRAVGRALCDGDAIALEGDRLVANPGSVGQPRDSDPRAAYALIDSERGLVSFHRVPYDIAQTQRLMRAAGLPDYLADRLSYGR